MAWTRARKKDVVVEFREPVPNCTHANGGEYERLASRGWPQFARPGLHYVIKGADGYPRRIKISAFEETYEVL